MRSRKNKIMAKIETKNLTVTYTDRKKGDTVAVNKISTVFEDGAFSAIIGASGSGKTTLLKNLLRLAKKEYTDKFYLKQISQFNDFASGCTHNSIVVRQIFAVRRRKKGINLF